MTSSVSPNPSAMDLAPSASSFIVPVSSSSSSANSTLSAPLPSANCSPIPIGTIVANCSSCPISPLKGGSPTSTALASRQSPQAPGNRPAPMCILTPCSNSHPFEERRIPVTRSEEDAVKIGRSVIRLQPSPSNAIFDCKVLSRNHAILWLNPNGQFMIKDMRSSNGTFINNERLGPTGEESEARELFSGDILQLGVEIVDNTKKVASGCVTCIVRLLNERGEECAGRPKSEHSTFPLLQQIPHNCTLVRNDKLFILDQYIKESKHRENLLGQKLQLLEEQQRTAQETLQTKWQEQVNQELLLSRIELLESQLASCAAKRPSNTAANKGTTSGSPSSSTATVVEESEQQRMAREMRELVEDRGRMEQMAKESLRAAQEQVQETQMRLHDAEMGLVNVEEECTFLRQRCTDFETQLGRQRDDYDALLVKYNEVCGQLSAAEKAVESMSSASTTSAGIVQNGGQRERVEKGTTTDQQPPQDISWVTVPDSPPVTREAEQQDYKQIVTPLFLDEEETVGNQTALPQQQIADVTQPPIDAAMVEELRQSCTHFEQELRLQQERYRALVAERQKEMEGEGKEEKATTSLLGREPIGQSPTDFQVFLLSAFPFLLLFVLFFSPALYFFGPFNNNGNPTTTPTSAETVEQQEQDQNDQQHNTE